MKSTKSGNSRAAQTRIKGKSAGGIGGQRAHDLRIGPQPQYVDPSRTYLNRVLIAPQTGTQLRKTCEERRALRDTVRAMKSSVAVGMVGIITFGHEAQKIFEALSPEEQDAAYFETAEAIAARLNTTLSGLVVHCDESAPHAHFQLPAYDVRGHPVSETAKRGAMRDLQTITAEVMGRHAPGIERGRSKLDRLQAGATPAEVINRSVAQLHDELPFEIAAKEAQLAELDGRIQQNEQIIMQQEELANTTRAAQSAAEARARAAEREAARIREEAVREARKAADALLEAAQERAAQEALRITKEASRRLEQQILTDGQNALLSTERERDALRTAFELFRDVLKSLLPKELYRAVRDRFKKDWAKHPGNPDRKQDLPSQLNSSDL